MGLLTGGCILDRRRGCVSPSSTRQVNTLGAGWAVPAAADSPMPCTQGEQHVAQIPPAASAETAHAGDTCVASRPRPGRDWTVSASNRQRNRHPGSRATAELHAECHPIRGEGDLVDIGIECCAWILLAGDCSRIAAHAGQFVAEMAAEHLQTIMLVLLLGHRRDTRLGEPGGLDDRADAASGRSLHRATVCLLRLPATARALRRWLSSARDRHVARSDTACHPDTEWYSIPHTGRYPTAACSCGASIMIRVNAFRLLAVAAVWRMASLRARFRRSRSGRACPVRSAIRRQVGQRYCACLTGSGPRADTRASRQECPP